MAFSPADLSWWAWILCGIASWTACLAALAERGNDDRLPGCFALVIGALSGFAAAGCFLLGVIRFVKWAWSA
jgi:hypothetical protein